MQNIKQIAKDYNVTTQAVRKRLNKNPIVKRHHTYKEGGMTVIDEEGVRLLMSGRDKHTPLNNVPAQNNRVDNQLNELMREQQRLRKEVNDLKEKNSFLNKYLSESVKDLTKRLNDLTDRVNNKTYKDPPQANNDHYEDAETRVTYKRIPRYEELYENQYKDAKKTFESKTECQESLKVN